MIKTFVDIGNFDIKVNKEHFSEYLTWQFEVCCDWQPYGGQSILCCPSWATPRSRPSGWPWTAPWTDSPWPCLNIKSLVTISVIVNLVIIHPQISCCVSIMSSLWSYLHLATLDCENVWLHFWYPCFNTCLMVVVGVTTGVSSVVTLAMMSTTMLNMSK